MVKVYIEILDLKSRSTWPTYTIYTLSKVNIVSNVHYLNLLGKWFLFNITSGWKRQVILLYFSYIKRTLVAENQTDT